MLFFPFYFYSIFLVGGRRSHPVRYEGHRRRMYALLAFRAWGFNEDTHGSSGYDLERLRYHPDLRGTDQSDKESTSLGYGEGIFLNKH